MTDFMHRLHFTVPGTPVAKGRPRLGMIAGRARAFTPAKTRAYESEIRAYAAEAWGEKPPLEGLPVIVTVNAYREIPASFSKKKADAARSGLLRPMTKPDADNHAKCIDALNGVVFKDDAAVVDLTVRKWYADRPRLEVEVRW